MFKWLERFCDWHENFLDSAQERNLRRLAAKTPGFEWLIVRAGFPDKIRSPMLSASEVREWFRQEFPSYRIVYTDSDNKIVFYE